MTYGPLTMSENMCKEAIKGGKFCNQFIMDETDNLKNDVLLTKDERVE